MTLSSILCKNHFYNYEDFSNLATGDGPELIIDSIKGDNIDKISIYEQVSSLEINVKDSDGNLFPHTAYYVIIRKVLVIIQPLQIQFLLNIKACY